MESQYRDLAVYHPSPEDSAMQVLAPREQAVLDEINCQVASKRSLEELIDFVFDAIQPIFPCDRISVAFVEEGGARLVSHCVRANYPGVILVKGFVGELHDSSLERVVAAGLPRIISDLEQYLAKHPQSVSTKLLVQEGIRSSMTCPLRVEERQVGVLFHSSRKPNAYGQHQIALHKAIGERLSQAVEKAWRIEQLAQANRAYMEMLGFVAHELKSPLASIVMDAQLMLDNFLGEINGEQRQKLQRMVERADYLLLLIRDYLDLARIEGGGLTLDLQPGVDLASVVNSAIELVQPQLAAKQVAFTLEAPAPLELCECDPRLVQIVIFNLLSNAVKYGREGGALRVVLGSKKKDWLFVSVWNEGPGFAPEQRSRLFRKFSRIESPELLKQKGTGIGLYTSWRIARLHGGFLRAGSALGKWAEFTLELPLRQHRTGGNSPLRTAEND